MATKRTFSKSPRTKKNRKTPLKVLSSKVVYDGKVFQVTSDKIKEPTGITARRDVIRHSGSVVVLAVDETDKEPLILLERQYRYAARDYLLELPAGRIDAGETALAAGKRELLEETGYRAKRWQRALHFYSSPGFLDETMTIFYARELTLGKAQPEDDECIETELLPLSKVVDRIVTGEIRDGKTIAGVLWLAAIKRREVSTL